MLTSDKYLAAIAQEFSCYNSIFLKNFKIRWFLNLFSKKYIADDPRSASYMATGMSSELNDLVLICCDNNIESRSIYSAMTESFYRSLPILAVLFSDEFYVNSSRMINDTFKYQFEINMNDDYQTVIKVISNIRYLLTNERMPISLIINLNNDREYTKTSIIANEKTNKLLFSKNLKRLSCDLLASDYIIISNKYDTSGLTFKCKVYRPSKYNSNEGILAMASGAALALKHDRYFAFVTEDEFIHDINTLGNRCLSSKLIFIVETCSKKDIICDYSLSLGFIVKGKIEFDDEVSKTVIIL